MNRAMLFVLCSLLAASAFAQPTIALVSPAQSSAVPAGPLEVTFAVSNWAIGGTGQDHLHIYVDADATPNMFYNAPTNDVLRAGVHTHFIHRTSNTSALFNGLTPGAHALRFVLADAAHVEQSPPGEFTLNVTVQAPVTGDLALTPVVTTGLNFPVAMAFAPDGRLFFTEKNTGLVRVMSSSFVVQATPFATVAGIGTSGEQGVLGICLSPGFASNGFVYVYHTATSPLRNRIIRYTESGGVGTALAVIKDNLPVNTYHNGGNIHFGPDGFLYVTCGDAQTPANSQSLSTLAGKILRLDAATGNAAPGNPFASTAGALPEIWALGVRNSFDFCFHPHTGDLWASENGSSSTDEINRIIAGANYGWPTYEGTSGGAPGMTDPLLDISPTVGPTGIVVLSSQSSYPAHYHGSIFMTDINGGRIRRVTLAGLELRQLGGTAHSYNGGMGGITDIEEGPSGFMYVFAGSNIGTGGLYRVDLSNSPPSILSSAPTSATAGQPYSYAVVAAGTPAITFGASGLPAWLTLTGNVLSGTPGAANLGATGNITITATNGLGSDMQTFSITVSAASTGGGRQGDDGGCSAGERLAPWLAGLALASLLLAAGRRLSQARG